MVPTFNSMSCAHLAVPPQVMQHVVQAESSGNPFAIGIVGGRLERQPRNLGEAVATARMLETKGYDFSLGIAQINRRNLHRYGLDSFEQAFDACANLFVGALILADCYGHSGADWGKAFSCYYSGNFTTGYRDGYVQRVFASLDMGASDASEPITVRPQTTERPAGHPVPAARPTSPGSSAYRVAIRSMLIDAGAGAPVAAVARRPGPIVTPEGRPNPAAHEPAQATASVFVPRVNGPVDPPRSKSAVVAGEQSAPGKETSDAAFVF